MSPTNHPAPTACRGARGVAVLAGIGIAYRPVNRRFAAFQSS